MREWMLEEVTYRYVKANPYEVAVLPMGATEPHNLHLPYGTDTFEAQTIAARSAEAAWRRNARVIVLPTIPYGTETNQQRCLLSMNLNPTTLLAVIRDLAESLATHGIRKLVILNSHGGNDLKFVIRELMEKVPIHIFLCDWFRGMSADLQQEIFDEPGDHAGEMETAIAMTAFPHLVCYNPHNGELCADHGATRASRFSAVNQGWVAISRPWHVLTTNTGAGNPHAATATKGEVFLGRLVERFADFLCELAAAEVDEAFPL